MNSYWVEHQARQRVEELIADAGGEQLARQSAASEPAPPDRPVADWHPTMQRAFAWLQALPTRSHHHDAQLR